MKGFVSGLIVGLIIALFTWWLQNRIPELHVTATQTQFEPVASDDSEFAGMSMYSVKVTNNGKDTAKNVNIEITIKDGYFVSANNEVPEKSCVDYWSLVKKEKKNKQLNLRYKRLLQKDSIKLGTLIEGNSTEEPQIVVRSDRVSGIPQELVEEKRRRNKAIVASCVMVISMSLPFIGLLITAKSEKTRKMIEVAGRPIKPFAQWFLGAVDHDFRARYLMGKGRYDAALAALKGSDEAYSRYLEARCYSAKQSSELLLRALEDWLCYLQKEYIDNKRGFDYLKSLPEYELLCKRLSCPLASNEAEAYVTKPTEPEPKG